MSAFPSVCLVAIFKNENAFLDEWLVYHRLIGIDHFFIYDDDPALPLKEFLSPHSDYSTIISWWEQIGKKTRRKGNQLTAYNHAAKNYISPFEWVIFLDADEFLILREHSTVKEFLLDYKDEVSISLNWHVFGHNGFYDNPTRLITSSLDRRMLRPFPEVKTITRSTAILNITTSHFCQLKYGERVDANHRPYIDKVYEGKTDVANINHYQCRSFKNWMKRVERGDVNFVESKNSGENKWRFEKEKCLERFVSLITRDNNEHVDNFMFKFRFDILKNINQLNRHINPVIKVNLTVGQQSAIMTRLELMAQFLISKTDKLNNIGLYNGNAGIAVFLFHYSRFTNNAYYHQFASKLLDDIIDKITEDSPVSCSDGIAGFGITVEHLVSESFIKIDTDELLEDIDVLINYHIIKDESPDPELYKNIMGLGKYYISRFNNPINHPYSHREHPNRLLLENITELINAPSNAYYNQLDYLNFLCEYYVHSVNRSNTGQYILREITGLNDIMNNNNDLAFEYFNPLYAAETLLKFSKKAEDETYSTLANTIIKKYENGYWQYINGAMPDDKKIESGLRYLHLAKLLKNTQYISRGLDCLKAVINDDIKNEHDLKKITGYGLILLTILSEWREGVYDLSLLFAIE